MYKKILSFSLCAVLLLSLFPAFLSPSESKAASASSVEDARDKIADAQARQEELQDQLDSLAEEKSNYMAQKELLEQQIGELETQIGLYDELIAGLDAEIALSEQKISEAQAVYDANIESFRAQARATYENGEVSYLEVLLGAKSFSDFLLRLDYVKQVSLYEKELLDTISSSIRVEQEEKAAIEANRAELSSVRAALQESKDAVDEKNAEISSLLAELKADETAYKDALEDAHQREEELNAWIEKELAGADSSVDYVAGDWIWPVARASYNYMSSSYGWRTLNGRREFHYAIDIAAPRGTPVLAAKSGVIKSAKWVTTGGGWQVVIDHGGTYYTYYNHLNSRPIVSAGQSVSQGQVVGYVGDSGYAFGTHLDFKIYYNGKAQDPAQYVKNPY